MILNTAQVAIKTRMSKQEVRTFAKFGLIPHTSVAGGFVFDEKDVEEAMAKIRQIQQEKKE